MEIRIITTPFFRNISVNSYLIKVDENYMMIDTGSTNKREMIEKELKLAGCTTGSLKLIVLTHGDFDHSGNAAYLRKKFGGIVAMHEGDSGMVENGNMLWNRNKRNILTRTVFNLFFKLKKSDRFKPDLYVNEGDDFSMYGFKAKVIEIPGHSKGSIAIITANGDLFCGDLLANTTKPEKGSIIDDINSAEKSIEYLKNFQIKTIYPGHGKPFSMELFRRNN